MNKIYAILYITIFLLTAFTCMSQPGNTKDLLQLFWKYDEVFAVKEERSYGLEKESKPYPFEIFDIDKISKKYKEIAQTVIQTVIYTTIKQIDDFKKLYSLSVDDTGDCITSPAALISPKYQEDNFLYTKLKPIFEESVLYKFNNCVRITYSIRTGSVFQLAKEIKKDLYAYTPYWPDSEYTLWTNYYENAEYAPNQTYGIVENYVIKYPYWFYESNLKLIVVVQVRDEAGNYYGELRVDLYKFDNYDDLFDKEGNPKVKK